MTSPLVSIALVTRNGAATLPALLDALSRQRIDSPTEIVAVDSGSTDGTVALLQPAADRFMAIPPATFNHGLTRNLAVEQSRGDLIVLIVQDAVPANDTWLAALIAPLVGDARVAGTFARQLPRPDASAITRMYFERAPAASAESRTLPPLTPAELQTLHPMDRLGRCTFDNVCSCIRRSVWREIPFGETPIAEDLEWSKAVLLAGHRLEYVATAQVFHSHERTASYELSRTYTLHARLFDLFEVRTIPTLRHLSRAIASSIALHVQCERQVKGPGLRIGAFARAIALGFAWPLGQYLGARSAARARR